MVLWSGPCVLICLVSSQAACVVGTHFGLMCREGRQCLTLPSSWSPTVRTPHILLKGLKRHILIFSVSVEGLISTNVPIIRQGQQGCDTGSGSNGSLSPGRETGCFMEDAWVSAGCGCSL